VAWELTPLAAESWAAKVLEDDGAAEANEKLVTSCIPAANRNTTIIPEIMPLFMVKVGQACF
jgi:hypothetical protein